MNRKLHISNLPAGISGTDLSDKFGRFGEVDFAMIIKDDVSGESSGFGLVEMRDAASAFEAVRWLNFSSYEGQIMSVSFFDADKAPG